MSRAQNAAPTSRARVAVHAAPSATAPDASTVARVLARYRSSSASGATRKPAKKWVRIASAENMAHHVRWRCVGLRQARAQNRNDAVHSKANSAYERASCEYQIMN